MVDFTIDLKEKIGQRVMSAMNISRILNMKWPTFNITLRALQFKNMTVAFDGDGAVFPTFGEEYKADQVVALRGTSFIGGSIKLASGSHIFFAKPKLGSRGIDCLGVWGPLPLEVHIVGNGLIIFAIRDIQS